MATQKDTFFGLSLGQSQIYIGKLPNLQTTFQRVKQDKATSQKSFVLFNSK